MPDAKMTSSSAVAELNRAADVVSNRSRSSSSCEFNEADVFSAELVLVAHGSAACATDACELNDE